MDSRPSTEPVGRRALLALYRNYPATAPGDRYNWKAYAEARRLRDELLAWAATRTDEELLWCRNLGPVALRWIREQVEHEHVLGCIRCGAALPSEPPSRTDPERLATQVLCPPRAHRYDRIGVTDRLRCRRCGFERTG